MSLPEARTHRCRHLFTQGHQCGSPSLREENFCYYHHTSRIPAPRPPRRTPCETEDFHLDIPEDRPALRRALGEVLRRLAAGRIDTKTAGLLLYGLQVVGSNLPPDPEPLTTPDLTKTPVQHVVMDPVHGPLAPAEDPEAPLEPGQARTSPARFRHTQDLALQQEQHDQYDKATAEIDARAARKRTSVNHNPYELNRLLTLCPPNIEPDYESHG
ncbi:hypothetical protein [Granulicella arctica]|uniref:hypothetical protein n=1 Tax=Granulicella arctica TaxID=940613 RepID=UPI0021DFDA93|nr:hypothetical protein [Granulicella arctica]